MPSTAIRRVCYDAERRILDVTFVTDRRYRYRDVPADLASAFDEAASKGGFFNAHIRDRFAYEELTRARA